MAKLQRTPKAFHGTAQGCSAAATLGIAASYLFADAIGARASARVAANGGGPLLRYMVGIGGGVKADAGLHA
jgi:hypothetical protein